MSDPAMQPNDAELRLECARLASVFSPTDADVMANAERMYRWIKNEEDCHGDRPVQLP